MIALLIVIVHCEPLADGHFYFFIALSPDRGVFLFAVLKQLTILRVKHKIQVAFAGSKLANPQCNSESMRDALAPGNIVPEFGDGEPVNLLGKGANSLKIVMKENTN